MNKAILGQLNRNKVIKPTITEFSNKIMVVKSTEFKEPIPKISQKEVKVSIKSV